RVGCSGLRVPVRLLVRRRQSQNAAAIRMIQNSSRNSPIFTSRRCGRYRCWLAAGTLAAAVVVARSVEQAEGQVAPPGAPAGLIFLGFSLPQNRAQLVRQVARGVLVLAEHVTVGLRVVE